MEAADATPPPRLAVILVNWNRASDTIECLEALARSDLAVRIIVVDNGSVDGSVAAITDWAAGTSPHVPADPTMAHWSLPPVRKPVPLAVVSGEPAGPGALAPLTVIEARANLGFAGGNNLGLRWALADPAIDQFWILNNDTVPEPGAARALSTTLAGDPAMGMCGTVVRYYWQPDMVQALNGSTFNLWTGQGRGIHVNEPVAKRFDAAAVATDTFFILGASLGVTRAFVETVGFMSERYFLYFEEADWAARNNGRFGCGFAAGATVYHKEGGSIGSSNKPGARSAMSDYYMLRSRLLFYRLYHPWRLPLVYALGIAAMLRRIVRGQPTKARAMARALLGRPY